MLFLARTQDLISVEVFSELPVITGCVLLLAGWKVLRVLAFPIGFLIFTIPAPGWMVDGATVPLKVFISDLVTKVLYAAGYPVAQNGVVIMIGPYQLLMKDACAGMNSIFALSAIGMFYVYAFRWELKLRSLAFLVTIIPITISCQLRPSDGAGFDCLLRWSWPHRRSTARFNGDRIIYYCACSCVYL